MRQAAQDDFQGVAFDQLERVLVGVCASGGPGPDAPVKAALEVVAAVSTAPSLRGSHPPTARVVPCSDSEDGFEAREAAVDRARIELLERGIACEPRSFSVRDSSLVRACRAPDLDLIVFGEQAPTHAFQVPQAATARAVLRESPHPVWVARPGTRPLPRVIVVATDLEPPGDEALRAALRLAGRLKVELHVVHAFGLTPSVQMAGETAAYAAVHRANAEERIAEIVEQVEGSGPRADIVTHVGVGSPSPMVIYAVERLQADLLVLGNVARRGVPGAVLGNTAERLLRRLATPLLVVRPDGFGNAAADAATV